MFTGIVQTTGRATRTSNNVLVVSDLDEPLRDLTIGESIAVNGCCLTLVSFENDLRFDLSEETLKRTTFGSWVPNTLVNLERALLPTSRLGGHFVSGHVDSVGKLAKIESTGVGWNLAFAVPIEFGRLLVDKGSICVDGISLTVNEPNQGSFWVAVIPHTWKCTNLRELDAGGLVNVEFDLIAKHVSRMLNFDSL